MNQNTFWYNIYVWPLVDEPRLFAMICLPTDVISTCVRTIVESRCGNMTAELVQDYILYLQHWAAQALESAGLDPDVCHHNIDITPADTYIPSQYDSSPDTLQPASSPYTDLVRLAEKIAPGSALDSVYGKLTLAYLKQFQIGDKYCNSSIPSIICMLSSADTTGMVRFNILQFAHQLIGYTPYHSSSCTRLGQFTSCWNLWQETCGSTMQWFGLQATLLVEGCKLQALMDDIGCHWQDMLIQHYIEASRRTVWPIVYQALNNPMFLDYVIYSASGVRKDLEAVISILQPGVEEIASRCGRQPAAQLGRLLNKIRYLQNDAWNELVKRWHRLPHPLNLHSTDETVHRASAHNMHI